MNMATHLDEKTYDSGKEAGYDDTHPTENNVGDVADVDLLALDGTLVNASGHRDQLQRHYGFFSICGLALSVDNAWVAVGTSLNVAICEHYQELASEHTLIA